MAKDSAYNKIMIGLSEALEDAAGKELNLKRNKISVEPVKLYGADEVKTIRKAVGMSQKTFASYLGVSNKTVEAWESGTNHPSGAASRILRMMEMDSNLISRFPFVTGGM